jgi:hypothetical protein
LVANDYTIDLATALGQNWYDWHTVARAEGRVQDRSNLRWVQFSYGFPSGLVTYGADADLQLGRVHIRAEYANNLRYSAYPGTEGERLRDDSSAYTVTALGRFGLVSLGGEVFRIPSSFTTSFPSTAPSSVGSPIGRYDLVDDNDDLDEWADAEDLNGVFPGLDENNDGVLDTNVNDNDTPDYVEPFLMYYVDADYLTFGDDFNNNGVVDAREDDSRPDYPYELDRQGAHIFVRTTPTANSEVAVGWYGIARPTGGGRNRGVYARSGYRATRDGFGGVEGHYLVKRVRDNIRSDIRGGYLNYMGYVTEGVIIPDLLAMRNSTVHSVLLDAALTRFRRLDLSAKIRYEADLRRPWVGDDGAVDNGGLDEAWALSAKGRHTSQVGRLRFGPMLKYIRERQTVAGSGRERFSHTWRLVPILWADWWVDRSTVVRLGVQGLPQQALKERFRNLAWPHDRYDATSRVVVLQNRGNYSGYDLCLNLGYRMIERSFRSGTARKRSSFRELFLRVYSE